MKKILASGLLFLTLLPIPVLASSKPQVIASFSIIGDMAHEIGGDNINIKTLVGTNGDAHEYSPTPTDAKIIASADLVLVNGLGFEGWMARLVKSSGYKGEVITLSNGVNAIDGDPHAWQDLANGKIYAANIRDALIKIDEAHTAKYNANAAAYIKKLDELDSWVKVRTAEIPPEKRSVISTHDAFGYFSRAYGINFIAPQGISTQSQASGINMAKLIDQIRSSKISVVFLENMIDPRLMKQLETDAGAHIGGTLYSDSLSEAGEAAPTYISMFKHNVQVLIEAIQKTK